MGLQLKQSSGVESKKCQKLNKFMFDPARLVFDGAWWTMLFELSDVDPMIMSDGAWYLVMERCMGSIYSSTWTVTNVTALLVLKP